MQSTLHQHIFAQFWPQSVPIPDLPERRSLRGANVGARPIEGSDWINTVGCRRFDGSDLWMRDQERVAQPDDDDGP